MTRLLILGQYSGLLTVVLVLGTALHRRHWFRFGGLALTTAASRLRCLLSVSFSVSVPALGRAVHFCTLNKLLTPLDQPVLFGSF